MGKHSKKRQRTNDTDLQPLGSVTLGVDKDGEETRLEELLFGTYTVAQMGPMLHDDTNVDTNGGLGNMMDAELFCIDEPGPSSFNQRVDPRLDRVGSPHGEGEPDADSAASADVVEESTEHLDRLDNTCGPSNSTLGSLLNSRTFAAWADPDDQNVQVSLASDNRLRKLRDGPQEDAIGGRDYEARLRRQYERVHPAPQWASTARDRLHKKKRRRTSQSSESMSDTEEGITNVLSTSGGLLSSQGRKTLPQGQLSIERLRDANQSAKAEGGIRSVMFHPSPSVPVLLTASADRRLRLFNIDGHTNPHLHSVHIPSLPLTTALFHPTGSSVLVTGHRPFYYSYDLQSGACTRSPRGLWGTHAANPDSTELSMETCAFSNTGDFLAVGGRTGNVHIVDWRRGGGQVVGSVKMNAAVKDLGWTEDGKLMSLGEDTQVYIWDVGDRRCIRRWKDDGGFGSMNMTLARGNAYLAIGSKTGLVNVYGPDSTKADMSSMPKPLKTIGHLTTSVSSMCFNHDAQILALASKSKKDQLKLVHLPSLTVFANWPASTTPLGHVTSMDFSTGSEYAAIGNNRGRVLLYNVRHFGTV